MNFFQNIGFAFGKNDRNYIENEISKTNNVNDIKKLIEKSNPEIIDYDLLNLAVSKGYEISANTPVPKPIDLSSINNYIQNTNNPNFVKFIIENSIQYIEYDTLYLAIQHSYKPSKDILEKFLKTQESRFNVYKDSSAKYGELPLIIESLDDSHISYDILRLATRLGYKVSDKTPILKFTTTEELKEFINSYVPIMYSQVQDSKEKFFLDNEHSHFGQIIKKIIAGNSDLVTYEIFDLAEEKNLYLHIPPFNTTPKVNSKEETKEILNNAKSLATIYTLVDNSNEKVMDAELFQEAIEHGYSIHYDTPKYVFEDEQYRSFVEEEKNNLLINPNKRLWNISPYLMNEVILENCYKNGDKITEDTPLAYRQPKYIKYAISKRHVDAINSLDASNVTEKELFDILHLAIQYGYEYSENSPAFLRNPKLIEYAIENGYQYSYRTPTFLRSPKLIEYAIERGQVDAINYLNYNDLKDKQEELEELAHKAIENGYQYSYNTSTPTFLRSPKLIEYAIERGQVDVINYLNSYYNLKDSEKEELIYKVIENGYQYSYDTPEFLKSPKFIECAIEKGNADAIKYLNLEDLKGEIGQLEELAHKAIENGYEYSKNSPAFLRSPKLIEYAIEKGQIDAIHAIQYLNLEDLKGEEGQLEGLAYKAIENGYSYFYDTPEFFKNSKIIKYAVEKGNTSAINYLHLEDFKGKEEQLEELIYKAIENGYRYGSSSPSFMCDFEYMSYAIEKGDAKAIQYLNLKYFKGKEGQLEELIYKAIENGYRYNFRSPSFMYDFEYISYAIEKGDATAIGYLHLEDLKEEEKGQLEELIYKAIENGYRYDSGSPSFMCDFEYISYAIENGQKDALYYLNVNSVTKKNIDIFKTYVTESCICSELMRVIRQLDFEDIGMIFNKQQLVAIKCLNKCPFLIKDLSKETFDNFCKDFIENKRLCNELFTRRNWKELFELIVGNDELIDGLSKNQLKILSIYTKTNAKIQMAFQDYILNNMDTVNAMTDEKLNLIAVVLKRLSYSNSSEMQRLSTGLATQLLHLDNPIEALDKIEDVFLKNNLPTVGKIYKVFGILHPNFQGFDFSQNSSISPILLSKSNSSREIIIFADLIKSFMGSNNRNFKNYLENLEQGNNIFLDLCNHKIEFEDLDKETIGNLKEFVAHLNTLYNNTKKGENDSRVLTGNIITDIEELRKLFSPNGNLVYDLPDRIIKMYCHFAGIDTLEQAKTYMKNVIEKANERNIKASASYLKLEQGDFVKGIGSITYLSNVLQNGSVAREFLGASADSDLTPLDTDLSMIFRSSNSVGDAISQTAAADYGPIWLVLKNRDNKFNITRRSPKEDNQKIDTKTTSSKLEAFYTGKTGADHYGIRTGFASSEIDYIVTKEYDDRIGFEIARNGFYIPVADETGKIIFTPDDYKKLRNKMQGLSYYDTSEYELSDDLETPEIIETSELLEKSRQEVEIKRQAIQGVIKKAIGRLDLELKEKVDGNLQEGYVELIDTGSTGRGTNLPGDGDFDYMMRLDKSIILDSATLSELKQELLKEFHVDNTDGVIDTGDFRLKQVMIEGLNTPIDIDITFTEKTDQLNYSTEMCLKDRLDSIKKQYPDKYNLVIANIIEAKKILKHAGAYKPDRGETPQGGLGGVGVENWILQNGGSLKQAAIAFSKASNGKSFEEFKKEYKIFDFGENHLSLRKGYYPYDNFVYHNMSESGYEKMKACLDSYSLEMKPVEEHSKHSK